MSEGEALRLVHEEKIERLNKAASRLKGDRDRLREQVQALEPKALQAEELQKQLESTKAELVELQSQIKSAGEGDPGSAETQAELERLKQELQARDKEIQLASESAESAKQELLRERRTRLFRDAVGQQVHDADALQTLMRSDLDKLDWEAESFQDDLNELLESQKQSRPYLFKGAESEPAAKPPAPGGEKSATGPQKREYTYQEAKAAQRAGDLSQAEVMQMLDGNSDKGVIVRRAAEQPV